MASGTPSKPATFCSWPREPSIVLRTLPATSPCGCSSTALLAARCQRNRLLDPVRRYARNWRPVHPLVSAEEEDAAAGDRGGAHVPAELARSAPDLHEREVKGVFGDTGALRVVAGLPPVIRRRGARRQRQERGEESGEAFCACW